MKHSKSNLVINTRDDARWEKDLIVVRDVLENDAYRIHKLKSLIVPQTVVDVGGHIGSFGLKVKQVWPKTRLIAFEPNVQNAELYRQNMKDNGFDNAQVFTEAICYEKNKSVLTDHMNSTGGGFLCSSDYVNQIGSYFVSKTDVALYTLEEVMARENIAHIDLLKLDCEGSEREIIKQMQPETITKIGLIVGEYHIEGGFNKFQELFCSRIQHLILVPMNPKNLGNIGEFLAVPQLFLGAIK